MAATRRIPLLILLLTTLTTAVELTVSGDPLVGEALSLTWTGEAPFSLEILTAASSRDAFTLYRSFSPITVTNGVWNVDVAAGTLVEFEISDATGDSASQFAQINDGGLALSSSVASLSSESVASTQSLSSVFSESSVASVSSLSVASTSSIAAATTTSTSGISTSTRAASHVSASPSQTISKGPSSTLRASSSTATQTSSIFLTPNQLNTSSGPKPGTIAGGVIAAILGLLLFLVLGRICYRRRQRARAQAQDAKIYPFMVDEALTHTTSTNNHRRTLSRTKPDVVNWNPEEPHLTPAGPIASGQEYFGNRNYRLSSSLGKFGELGVNINALGMDLNPPPAPAPAPAPAATPAPPQPVMTTVPNATMPSVLDLARGSTKRASDMPLYNTASIYNPTSLQQPNFGRPSLDSQNGSGSKISPFADKFAVEGKYEPDLDDPAVMASVASAQAPRPPRPARPEGLELEQASASDASASSSSSTPTQARPKRNSISNPGPVPTVGHTRKISGPIPIVMPKSPPVRGRQQRSVDTLPSWALVNSDGRYPVITVQTPSTASMVSSPTGSMAGVGAGRVASSQPGRQIYPAAALPPTRQPSLKGKRVSLAQSERGMTAAELQAARAQSPPIRSPPPGALSVQSPTAVATRAQSPPAIFTRAQSPPIMAALAQSPPPTASHNPSRSVDAPPPRPPRAVGPRPKPATQRSTSATPPAPIVTLPLTPPRRILAEPDVPTTPTTPALSSFPTPPRSMKNVTSPSSLVGSMGHQVKGSGSSVASSASTIIAARDSTVGPAPTTAATSAFPDFEFNGPTPVASPQAKGRALQPPPPISTGLNPASSNYTVVSSAPNGLSPITASPQSVQHPQIPTPLASSTIGSPTTLAQFGQAMLPGGGGITRDNSVKTTYTMSTASEGTHSVLRRELMQGLPSAAGMAHNFGPSSPTYFPESVSNYHPPAVPQLPLPVTSSARVPRPAVESWGIAASIYDASSMNGVGKHVSIAPSYLSANSGRRLSESTSSGDAEWKELERQLAVNGGDVPHIMPKNNGTM